MRPVRGAHDELHVELVLYLRDVFRERRLRQVQLARRLGEVERFAELHEFAHLVGVHGVLRATKVERTHYAA